MAITASDLILYGCTGRVTTDTGGPVGGNIDEAARPLTAFLSSAQAIELISSSSADTRTATLVYRTTDGVSETWTPTLAGTSAVPLSTGTPEHIMSLSLSSASTAHTVTLRVSSGQALHTINPGETDAFRMFLYALSTSGSSVTRYEKLFLKNVSTEADLSNALIAITSDASTQYRIGLSAAVNSSSEWTNRLTDPSVTMLDTSSGLAVPGSTLGSTDAIGIIVEQVLAANATEGWPTFMIEASGGTIVST